MSDQRVIEVFADWEAVGGPTLMGRLSASLSRGKEIFSFEYDDEWLGSTGPNPEKMASARAM